MHVEQMQRYIITNILSYFNKIIAYANEKKRLRNVIQDQQHFTHIFIKLKACLVLFKGWPDFLCLLRLTRVSYSQRLTPVTSSLRPPKILIQHKTDFTYPPGHTHQSLQFYQPLFVHHFGVKQLICTHPITFPYGRCSGYPFFL